MTEANKNRSGIIRRLVLFVMMAMILSFTVVIPAEAESSGEIVKTSAVPNPGTELWREVRQRGGPVVGVTQVSGVDAGTLVNVSGENWRQFRVEQIIPYSGYLLGLTLLLLIVFRLIRGEVKIESGRSGHKIFRFSLNQRTIHWVVASLFVILGLTGIIQLLGRTLLIPVMGNSAFSGIASFGKLLHDYLGPVFAIALIFMLVSFIKGNFYKLKDINWFLNGGGMLGKHASAGRYNAGEKSWFWLAMLGGAVIIVSGLILDFPIFDQSRDTMEFYLVIHGIASIAVLAAAFGHIYMGTVAMEGALESMTTGYCDANWAKEHHDEWYEEVKDSVDVSSDVKTNNNEASINSNAQPGIGA
ncbi:MAG: formate dehydrogenase subunit gamma [Gammaproteobacteria bacterium]|nr:formate dehydrogenase subunit gamma [Gammaproteobacteria bacterium]